MDPRPRVRTAQRVRATLLAMAAACCVTLTAVLACAADAGAAEGYGELTRFGEVAGGREVETEKGHLSEARTLAIGVDGEEENSAFVLEELKREEIVGATTKRFFRLKKFKPNNKGKYAESASVDFQETSPHLQSEALNEQKPGVDGLVVDAKESRVYLLTADLRAEADSIDKIDKSHSSSGEGVLAASTLYAFSTKEQGEALVGAPGTTAGVLAGESVFQPQSNTPGKALLDPQGMTLDPATHELILLAHVDQKGNVEDNIANETDHYVLQRILPNGQLGSTYTDSTNKFKEKFEGFVHTPTSPVVVPGAGGKASEEHVYVDFDGLAEVPREFGSSEAPHALPLSKALNGGTFEHTEWGLQGPAPTKTEVEYREARAPQGGRLSVSAEGTVFGTAKVELESVGKEGHEGVLAMSGTNGEPIGWTGGNASKGNGVGNNECVVGIPIALGLGAQVAAGSGGTVFALAPEFLRQEEEERNFEEIENEEEEVEVIELEPTFSAQEGRVTKTPAIIEFGPGGKGCAPASAEGPEDEVNGTKKVEEIAAGTEVKFTSKIKQADATRVVWTFEVEGSGKEETVEQTVAEQRGGEVPPQPYREPSLRKKFTTNGSYKVTETIYNDDLAALSNVFEGGHLKAPAITLTLKHPLKITPGSPTAAFTWTPAPPKAGEAVKFEAKATDPNGASGQPLEYTWTWGDGTTTGPSTSALATHTFPEVAEAKTYNVVLEVKNKLGKTTKVEHQVLVNESNAKKLKEEKEKAEKEQHEKEQREKEQHEREQHEKEQHEKEQHEREQREREQKEREQKEKEGHGPPGGGEVLPSKASVAGNSLSVSPSGAFTLKIDCAGQSSCAGSVNLKTASAVTASKKKILPLAAATFSISAGQVKSITLHLSSKARALLKRMHTLKAKATLVSTSAGETHTIVATVTLKLKHH
jgi:hypothetical protein